MIRILLFVIAVFLFQASRAQEFTRYDTLRGSITPERAWWDLQHYTLEVKVDPKEMTIEGSNTIRYKVISEPKRMQIELQKPMVLKKAVFKGEEIEFEKDRAFHFLTIPEQIVGQEYEVVLSFGGKPREAKHPPWDGGLTWSVDSNGVDFIANSNQGLGASVWWPNKDHAYDEPDEGIIMKVEVPENLMDVSNGRLIKTEHNKERGTKTYTWQVVNPINNYGVNVNIADYVHFSEKYEGEKGTLDMDYYVLSYNEEIAKKHLKDQAEKTMEAFEHWFGPYPFYEDGYKLVEAPYLGMEHQSSVTYGNGYQMGYRGRGSKWGMKFDYIVIHESGHEWFANNITHIDPADMWIHEGFTNYSEALYVDYHFGKEAGEEFIQDIYQWSISNRKPIIANYNVNQEGSGDMYAKGAVMLHMVRQIIDNDSLWRNILRGLNKDFYHQCVSSTQVEEYIIEKSGKDLAKFFDQYLRDTRIPTLRYAVGNDGTLYFKWNNCIEGFDMPIAIWVDGEKQWVVPNDRRWTNIETEKEDPQMTIDPNFYVTVINPYSNPK